MYPIVTPGPLMRIKAVPEIVIKDVTKHYNNYEITQNVTNFRSIINDIAVVIV